MKRPGSFFRTWNIYVQTLCLAVVLASAVGDWLRTGSPNDVISVCSTMLLTTYVVRAYLQAGGLRG